MNNKRDKKINTLLSLMNSAIESKRIQEEETVVKALSDCNFRGANQLRISRKKSYIRFGVSFNLPDYWRATKINKPNDAIFLESGQRTGGILNVTRFRADFRGYENCDKMEHFASAMMRDVSNLSCEFIDTVKIRKRDMVRAVCVQEDVKQGHGAYRVRFYYYYKSKTEILVLKFSYPQENEHLYIKMIRETLESLHRVR